MGQGGKLSSALRELDSSPPDFRTILLLRHPLGFIRVRSLGIQLGPPPPTVLRGPEGKAAERQGEEKLEILSCWAGSPKSTFAATILLKLLH